MKKLIRQGERFHGRTLGLDHHQSMIQYSLLDEAGDEVANEPMPATEEAVRKLIKEMTARGPVQVALEATGSFLWLYDLLVELLGRARIHVAAPSRVRVIAEANDKDDAKDAWWLAYLLWDRRLPLAFVAEGKLRDLRVACRERRTVTEERATLKRRMKSHLAQLGKRLPRRDWESMVGFERIEALVASVSDRGMYGEAIARLWLRIQDLSEELEYWCHRISELTKAFEPIQELEARMAGFGPVIAPVIWAEMGDPRRFVSAKAYGKGTGLTPGYRCSAGKRRGRPRMTREGSAHVRWALTRAIVATLRSQRGPGLVIRRWVEAKAARSSKKAAIVAAARKLAESVWRLFHYQEDFDLAKAFAH